MRQGRRYLLAVLILFGVAGSAFAQDPLLDSYQLAIQSLENSVRALPIDNVQSLDSLERAAGALIPLSRENGSNQLVSGIEGTIEQARTAIANRQQTNLAVRASVIAGGFQRLVYESALREANNGNIGVAQQRLERIANDMGMTEESIANILTAQDLAALRGNFELGAARAIQGRLENARAQIDSFQAYEALAEAYSIYIPVQDSPRLSEEIGNSFVSAISALVGDDTEALSAQLGSLETQVSDFATRASSFIAQPGSAQQNVPSPGTPPDGPLATEQSGAIPAPEAAAPEAAPQIQDQPEPADSNLVAPSSQPNAQPSSPQAAPAQPAQPEASQSAASPSEQASQSQPAGRQQEVAALQQSLAGQGVTGAQNLAERYYERGFSSVDEVINALYTLGARSIVAVEVGDQQQARNQIREFQQTYVDYLQPIVNTRDADFHRSTLRLLDRLEGAPALRLQDTVVLAGHVDAISSVIDGQRPSAVHSAIVSTNLFWIGTTRVIVMIVLFILAFVPIYLLFLAFGGGNRNWIWVGTSLFLLLLPVMYEGLSFLLSGLASLSGVTALDVLSQFSIFQNTISQVVWVIITAVAIGFAIAGLYGICVQFGLISGRSSGSTGTNASQVSETQVGAGTRDSGTISWDDDM